MALTKEEIERYSRQILLHGLPAQERLKASRVLVIGAGGLGSATLPLLAAAGVGAIDIFDGDKVERVNLGRQTLFRESDIGSQKADASAVFLRSLNPYIEITPYTKMFTLADSGIFAAADLIVEGSDSITAKFLINDLALRFKKPAFIAALGKAQGHAMLVGAANRACYRCMFDVLNEDTIPNCATEGILSTFPAVVGSMVAHAAVEQLLFRHGFPDQFWVFEKNHCRKVQIKKRQNCNHPA